MIFEILGGAVVAVGLAKLFHVIVRDDAPQRRRIDPNEPGGHAGEATAWGMCPMCTASRDEVPITARYSVGYSDYARMVEMAQGERHQVVDPGTIMNPLLEQIERLGVTPDMQLTYDHWSARPALGDGAIAVDWGREKAQGCWVTLADGSEVWDEAGG